MKNFHKRASRAIKATALSVPLFFAGCYSGYVSDTVVVERRAADRVEVVEVYQPGFHYSPFYGGYVPIIVPIGGYIGPNYFQGGYRPSRTVVNNYVTTHKTTVVRSPAASTGTRTTTTTSTSRPVTPSRTTTTTTTSTHTSTSTVTSRSTAAPHGGSVRSGGFGSSGRSSGSAST